MRYLPGYTIRPYNTTFLGEVLFTDGTNDGIRANQTTCEAYGYTYDRASGTCSAFNYSTKLVQHADNINNKNNGFANTTGTRTNTVQINGTNNTTKGNNNDCFINGSNNEIANGVNNATVVGVGGKANRQGDFVIGGGLNAIGGQEADRKVSVVNLSGVTTDNTATLLAVNGDGTNYINIKNNSIVGFEIYITRLEVAGSSATLGNYSYRNIKGVVQIDDAYGMLFVVGFTRNIGKIGVNGTAVMRDSSISAAVPSISIQVTDRNNVTNVWSATVTLHELISTNISF